MQHACFVTLPSLIAEAAEATAISATSLVALWFRQQSRLTEQQYARLAQHVGRATVSSKATPGTAAIFSTADDFGQQSRLTEQQYAFFTQQACFSVVSSEPTNITPTKTKARASFVNMV